MDSERLKKRVKIGGRSAAILLGMAGLSIICMIILLMIYRTKPKDIFVIIFSSVLLIPAIAFGIYCMWAAYKIWMDISARNLRRMSFAAAILITVVISGPILHIIKGTEWDAFYMPIEMMLAGIIYLGLNKALKKWFCLPDEQDWARREKSIKRFFGWLAFFMWSACNQMWIKNWEPSRPNELWIEMLILIGSIIATFVFYKICIRIALYKKSKEEVLIG